MQANFAVMSDVFTGNQISVFVDPRTSRTGGKVGANQQGKADRDEHTRRPAQPFLQSRLRIGRPVDEMMQCPVAARYLNTIQKFIL